MKYTAEYTTKWHDTDANRIVRPSQLLVYMQETSNMNLKSCGMDLTVCGTIQACHPSKISISWENCTRDKISVTPGP